MQTDKVQFRVQSQYWKALVILAFLIISIAWLLNTPPGFLGKADAVGYAVCHRIDLRSFHIGDRQMSLCSRCSGMYLGALLGLIYQGVIGRRRTGIPSWKILVPVSIFALLFIVDGVNSFLSLFPAAPSLYEPNNTLRLFTGAGMGLAIAIALYPAFNSTVWRLIDPRPALLNMRSFLVLVLLAAALNGLILLNIPFVLYILSLVSAAGVLVLLTLVYTMIIMMVFKVENGYNQARQMGYALIGGLTVALIQIGLLDFLRFLFTGTWEGFHL
ncbi:MAG: DUF2085 domain-containing protein [Chloroflexota bacterium]|nr:MAG: DUF2085 domain-containing protein [Chloroflexota bacterium]